jgi:type IV pilus assembly protein PilM
MPPIEKKDAKKIPDLVRYEASQQIPFDIEDVVWDYQVFAHPDTPDIEVGIFAIRKDLIRRQLGYFAAAGIAPVGVQTIPVALYNFCLFDGQMAEGGATVIVDVGAQNTDLIIVEPNSAWTRNIPLGGNSFTEALVRAFKLSFAKAESLKRSAATSKYARQIFQAMRPVFAELVAEIQRSIGFYSSTHREVELRRVLALGNAFRLPGLQKYLENNLTIPGGVTKLEKFAQMAPSATITAPQFVENVLSFAAAYGLAVQGLGLAKIRTSLLPAELARIAVWQKKRPYFIATAASLLLGAAFPMLANALDKTRLESGWAAIESTTNDIRNQARKFRNDYQAAQIDTGQREQAIKDIFKLQEKKMTVPHLLALVHEAMPPINPPELASVASAAELKAKVKSNPAKYDRTQRGQLIIEKLSIEFVKDVDGFDVTGEAAQGGGLPTPIQPVGPIMQPGAQWAPGMGPPIFGGSGPPGRYPMGGRGGPMGPGYQQPPGVGPTGEAPAEEAPKAPGFVVRMQARLLYGRQDRKSDAQRWITNYNGLLKEQSRKPGLGFYIPEDDTKDPKNKKLAIDQVITPYHQGSLAPPAVAIGVAPASEPAVQFPDPATGEETKSDWRVTLVFKARLGELPKETTASAPAGPGGVGGPGVTGGTPPAKP